MEDENGKKGTSKTDNMSGLSGTHGWYLKRPEEVGKGGLTAAPVFNISVWIF